MIGWLRSRTGTHLIIAVLALLILLPLLFNETGLQARFEAANAVAGDVQFSLPAGYYDQAINLRLTAADPDTVIYFSTDGSLPTAGEGTLYAEPLHLPANPPRTVVVRALAQLPDGSVSEVKSGTYFINLKAELPLVSVITAPNNLWNASTGIFANPFGRGREWERDAEVLFYEPENRVSLGGPAGIRVHGGGSRGDEKKSLRLYFRNEYGQPAIEYPLFPDSEKGIFKRLVLHNGGQDYPAVATNATLLRNQLVGNLVREEGSFATYSRPVILFINGQNWGIYNLRELIDARYLKENFQMGEADLLVGFERSLKASSGDLVHWENLLDFVTTHDLSVEENFAAVEAQINLENFIDYSLFQIITANPDWPHNNQLRFRNRNGGRWHWMFWDSDFAFGLTPHNYYIEKNMFERVLGSDDPERKQAAELLTKLLEHPGFKARFLGRMADMLNTVFVPEKVVGEIDLLAALYEQDIDYETMRWSGSGNWEAGVEYIREFARQRPATVREQAVAFFDLAGTSQITLEAFPAEQGSVSVNGGDPIKAGELPWQGIFFHGSDVQLIALPAPGYRFAGWDPPELPQTPVVTVPVSGDLVIAPIFKADDGGGVQAGDVRFIRFGRAGDSPPVDGLQGDWLELQVQRTAGVDLRGWRVTDNDSVTATDEGSLILGDHPALVNVPVGATILLVASQTGVNDQLFPVDDTSSLDGQLILYAGNENLDANSDSWFSLGANDNLVLLAPGDSTRFDDDRAIDFLTLGRSSEGVMGAAFGLSE